MRTYFSDDSFITKRDGYVYIRTYEKLNKDNWDTESNDWLAKAYNAVRPSVGKTVKLMYTGPGYKREFYFPVQTGQMKEITKNNENEFEFLKDVLTK